ncbi:MAG: hypothetical protein HYU69_15555 [Bacteroidetes bacterium]|nr:hypothetical protein [Bacteroidota bacterium]
MKVSNDLFSLVKSLNKNEKGYFKKVSSMHVTGKKNRYMILFDAIDEQEKYDEEEIKQKFKDEPFVKQLHPFKNYLYNSILWSLELYHQRSALSLIQRHIRQIEILRSKGLFDQCLIIIKKAKKLANDRGYFLEAISISKLEIIVVSSSTFIVGRDKKVDEVNKEIHKLNKMHINRQEYSYLLTKINMLHIKEGDFSSEKLRKRALQIFKKPLLRNKKNALTIWGELFFYICHFLFYKNCFDDGSALRYGRKCIEIMEKHSALVIELPTIYTSLFSDMAEIHLRLSEFNEAFVLIEKLKALKNVFRDKITNHIISLSSACFELIYYNQTGRFNEGIRQIERIEDELKNYTPQSTKRYAVLLKYYMSCLYFGVQNYRQANKKIAEVINEQSSDVQINVQCYSRILRIIIFFEMKDEDALVSQIFSTYRFLLKKSRLNKFDSLVVNFFKKNSSKIKNDQDLISAFKILKREIDIIILRIPSEREIVNYFNYSCWLESKIQNRSFAEVVKEKNHQRRTNKK